MLKLCAKLHHAVGKTAVHTAFVLQSGNVDIGDRQLGLSGETFSLSDNFAVLGDDSIPAKDEVGGRFAVATRGIYIGSDTSCALALDQVHEIGVLADHLVARRQVHNEVGAVDGSSAAGWRRHPQILANLDSDTSSPSFENQASPKIDLPTVDHDAILAGKGGNVA